MSDYATLDEFKTMLRIDDAGDDAMLQLALNAAKTAIDRSCNRTFDVNAAPEARIFSVSNDEEGRSTIDIDDTFDDADAIGIFYSSLGDGDFDVQVTGDFRMAPFNASSKSRPYTRIICNYSTWIPSGRGRAEVTCLWGWDATPDTIKQATMLQASRYFKRRDAPFGIAGSPEVGSELRLLARLDPDVEVMVADFRRWRA